MNDLIKRINQIMGSRHFFTSADLIRLGIFGSKSAVWRAVKLGYIEAIYITDRRRVIMKESLLNYIKRQNDGL